MGAGLSIKLYVIHGGAFVAPIVLCQRQGAWNLRHQEYQLPAVPHSLIAPHKDEKHEKQRMHTLWTPLLPQCAPRAQILLPLFPKAPTSGLACSLQKYRHAPSSLGLQLVMW